MVPEYSWLEAKQERVVITIILNFCCLERSSFSLHQSLKKRNKKNTLGPHCDGDLGFCVLGWGSG